MTRAYKSVINARGVKDLDTKTPILASRSATFYKTQDDADFHKHVHVLNDLFMHSVP